MTERTNPVALVTGASGGTAFELASIFASEGHDVIITSEDRTAIKQAAQRIRQKSPRARVDTIVCDLFRPPGARELYDTVQQLGRAVDVLVCNSCAEADREEDDDLVTSLAMIQLNAVSPAALAKLFAREMLARGSGKILLVCSSAGVAATAMATIHGATTAFLLAFAAGLRSELEETRVGVTAFAPDADQPSTPAKLARDAYDALIRYEL